MNNTEHQSLLQQQQPYHQSASAPQSAYHNQQQQPYYAPQQAPPVYDYNQQQQQPTYQASAPCTYFLHFFNFFLAHVPVYTASLNNNDAKKQQDAETLALLLTVVGLFVPLVALVNLVLHAGSPYPYVRRCAIISGILLCVWVILVICSFTLPFLIPVFISLILSNSLKH